MTHGEEKETKLKKRTKCGLWVVTLLQVTDQYCVRDDHQGEQSQQESDFYERLLPHSASKWFDCPGGLDSPVISLHPQLHHFRHVSITDRQTDGRSAVIQPTKLPSLKPFFVSFFHFTGVFFFFFLDLTVSVFYANT